MEISILFSGEFGRRFVLNFVYPEACPRLGACGIEFCDRCKDYDFSSAIGVVEEYADPLSYGVYIDEPEALLPELSDLVIAINLHPDLLLELPLAGADAILIPVEDPKWCSPGLRNQIAKICDELGIEFAAPKPLCSFKPESRKLRRFCEKFDFGMPEFKIKAENSRIIDAKALKDTCGCSHFVAKMMKGHIIENREEFWKEIHQHQCAYPCMASMDRDVEIKEAPFHLAGYIMGNSFSKAAGIDCMDLIPPYLREYMSSV
ncbi:MAG: hypothetical protein H0Z28_03035 [Archaeoglobus sp.]|nr:hypothetical protein [Archaeoglobus sp.]